MRTPRVRLKDILFARKPKTPGFGISRDFYLSVLAATAQLPSLAQVVSPSGEGGALKGYGVPLGAGAGKEDLTRPMARGGYGIASLDRKSVLRVLVVPRDEAGFNPETFLKSEAGSRLKPEMAKRIRATWTIVQLAFEAHDPSVFPSLDFIAAVARRMAELTDGVVADPMAQRYRAPEEMETKRPQGAPVWAPDLVSLGERLVDGRRHLYTVGMRKLALPEFEIYGVEPECVAMAERLLLGICQTTLLVNGPEVGELVGNPSAPLRVATGGLDRAIWEGVPCLELIAEKGTDVNEAVRAWSSDPTGQKGR